MEYEEKTAAEKKDPEFQQEYNCCYGSEMGPFTPKKYEPEMLTFDKTIIYAAISALESGLEYAQECLIRHDQNLGRTISRNKREAEYMEEDIEKIKAAIKELKS
jgi:hypothetical protein